MSTVETNSRRIKKQVTPGALEVSRVYKSDFQKEGTLTAEIKQKIVTITSYPGKSVENSIQENIFDANEFGFEDKNYENVETRVAWIDVPTNSTIESVSAKLATFPDATLFRILSNRPIIADTEQYAIDSADMQVTLDDFANRQVVRYPAGSPDEGELALDANGKVQYRRVAFSAKAATDQDMRTLDPADMYLSLEIEQEVNAVDSVLPSQSL